MDPNNLDDQDILKTPDVHVDESTDSEESHEVEVDYKAELEKARQIAENQKIRAEKAEAKLKGGNSTGRGETSKYGELSAFDIIAVTKANLDEEALKEAMDYAKYKKISVAEAIKSPAVKATIQLIEENRRVTEAANVGSARRGSSKISDEALLENARKGIFPENDADTKRLIQIRKRNI